MFQYSTWKTKFSIAVGFKLWNLQTIFEWERSLGTGLVISMKICRPALSKALMAGTVEGEAAAMGLERM